MDNSARLRPLTGVILAGGAGRRMGGQDKGLVVFYGRPLIAWVIDALAPQVDELLIVANRNLETYRSLGYRVVSDSRPDFAGPLAGFESALAHASHEWVVTCPTDVPSLPGEYVRRMTQTRPDRAAVAIIENRWQPVFSLIPRAALANLSASLDAGERKLQCWLETLDPTLIELDEFASQLCDADNPEELAHLAKPPHSN